MRNLVPDLIICGCIVVTLGVVHLLLNVLRISLGSNESEITLSELVDQHSKEYGWLINLAVNGFGYSCIFIPRFLIYKYTNRTNYPEQPDKGFILMAVKFCLAGSDVERVEPQPKQNPNHTMTKERTKSYFKDYQFLVFANRVLPLLSDIF